MKKHWSISTTVRNAERVRNFLIALKELDGVEWDNEAQMRYQILLIQKKFYGLTTQFFNSLSQEQISILKDPEEISYEQAKDIFDSKNYTDPAMRGRQSFNPLKKMGLGSIVDQKIRITSLGEYLLQDDYDLGEMFFKSFLKWQVPNPDSDDFKAEDGFCIKPFVGTLHLIKKVNKKWQALGKEPKGISKEEFSLFVPTLIHYREIDAQAQRVIDLRLAREGKSNQEQRKVLDEYKKDFAGQILDTDDASELGRFISNLKDYGDNTLRYFRLTRYLHIRGGGFYVDLEPRRHIELEALLKADNASPLDFENVEAYREYISDITQPVMPWETDEELKKIANALVAEMQQYTKDLRLKGGDAEEFAYQDIEGMHVDDLKDYIYQLRTKRRKLQDLYIHLGSQAIENIEGYIKALEKIHRFEGKKSIELERLATLALNALNDALEINPNYPVGDDNEPTFTAPANKADIECFYERFNSICEVTMLTDRSQWYNEGQPVMRHVRDFEDKHSGKDVYCLFIAPRLHQDTIETFWMSIKYGYRGATQRIVPISIGQLIKVLKALLSLRKQGKRFAHPELLDLYDKVISLTAEAEHSDMWLQRIPEVIDSWEKSLLSKV
ncbi:MAG: AlwI family type II restriction endonuclease [Syntrophaceae bacterium]|nr:AlwI family type II restriction endonuclease [Syntrophaceae bacterium]